MKKFKDIKQFPNIHYRVDIPLDYVEKALNDYISSNGLDMNPDFQRDYVWTEDQKISYLEYLLKNPQSGKEIYFNHPGWMYAWKGDFVLVDGKQRLNAILDFLHNKIPVFGTLYKDYKDKLPITICLGFNIATLKTRKEVLQWYLDFNTGGTYHTKDEIEKVKLLIKEEG